MNWIRDLETNFGSRMIKLQGSRDEDEIADIHKNCFWINLFNYAILSRVLELYIQKPNLLKELDSCTKFICLMNSTQVQVNREVLTCYDIFKKMLRLDAVHLLGGLLE